MYVFTHMHVYIYMQYIYINRILRTLIQRQTLCSHSSCITSLCLIFPQGDSENQMHSSHEMGFVPQ